MPMDGYQGAWGFTLTEGVIVLLIAGILLAIGIPAYSRLHRDITLTSEYNRVLAAMRLARRTAVTRGRASVLCTATNARSCSEKADWDDGWLLFSDPNGDEACTDADGNGTCDADGGRIVAIGAKSPLTIRGNDPVDHYIRFASTGHTWGYMGTLSICDDRGLAHARGLVLRMSGRVRLGTASNAPSLHCP